MLPAPAPPFHSCQSPPLDQPDCETPVRIVLDRRIVRSETGARLFVERSCCEARRKETSKQTHALTLPAGETESDARLMNRVTSDECQVTNQSQSLSRHLSLVTRLCFPRLVTGHRSC